jgi:hypothetical protein
VSASGSSLCFYVLLVCCGNGQKVAGSIPGGVYGIFHSLNPLSLSVAAGPTQPLTEMSTRDIF